MLIVEQFTEYCLVLLTNGIDVRSVVQFTVQTAAGLCQGKVQPLKARGCATFLLEAAILAEAEQFCFDIDRRVKTANRVIYTLQSTKEYNMSDSEQEVLWLLFMNRDEVGLLSYLRDHPESTKLCKHHYPESHRVCDILLGGYYYRVVRCAVCRERLTFVPIPSDSATPWEEGVPDRVTGQGLWKWIHEEKEYQRKLELDPDKYYDDNHGENIDWNRYMSDS